MSNKKNQLHQLLAVENDRKKHADNIMNETAKTFSSKQDHFDGMIKTYSPKNEEDGIKLPEEIKNVYETVRCKIKYSQEAIIKAIDAQISKEETNSSGMVRAELKVDDVSFGDLSATSLLALEQYLVKVRNMYKTIPTLDPTKIWNKDSQSGDDIYTTSPEERVRTEKIQEPIILCEPTKEHPAQTQLITKDVHVGTWKTIYKSGKITPKQKSDILTRVDKTIDCVKQARSKANEAEVINKKIGEKIFDYIDNGIL